MAARVSPLVEKADSNSEEARGEREQPSGQVHSGDRRPCAQRSMGGNGCGLCSERSRGAEQENAELQVPGFMELNL